MILSRPPLIENRSIDLISSHQHIHLLYAGILVFVLCDNKPHFFRPYPYLGLRNFLCVNLPSNAGLP